MREASRLLAEGLAELAVPDPGRAAPLLESYMDELERWNPRFGLVKFGSREDLVIRHVLDSLSAWSYVCTAAEGAGEPGGRATVLDIGSGAGLPGIPLAVALPGLSFTLLERMARRASFLRTCTLLLGLPRVTVMQRDLGEVRGFFDIVTFRAYAPLSRFLDESTRAGPRWRTLLAYKGKKESAAEELDAVRARVVSAELVTLRTPFLDEERCLVTLRQVPLIDKPVRSG